MSKMSPKMEAALQGLREIFESIESKPFRKYDLVFIDGKPQWVRNEMDLYLDRIIREASGLPDDADD